MTQHKKYNHVHCARRISLSSKLHTCNKNSSNISQKTSSFTLRFCVMRIRPPQFAAMHSGTSPSTENHVTSGAPRGIKSSSNSVAVLAFRVTFLIVHIAATSSAGVSGALGHHQNTFITPSGDGSVSLRAVNHSPWDPTAAPWSPSRSPCGKRCNAANRIRPSSAR